MDEVVTLAWHPVDTGVLFSGSSEGEGGKNEYL
mgnify:CR=1 FL=1